MAKSKSKIKKQRLSKLIIKKIRTRTGWTFLCYKKPKDKEYYISLTQVNINTDSHTVTFAKFNYKYYMFLQSYRGMRKSSMDVMKQYIKSHNFRYQKLQDVELTKLENFVDWFEVVK